MLADHPDVLARLRKEVLDTLGSNGKVNHENLREMKYLRAVLNGQHSLASRRQSILTCPRDSEVVPKCVRISISPNSHHVAKNMIAVRGISDAPKKGLSGQNLMGGNRSTFQVARKFTTRSG